MPVEQRLSRHRIGAVNVWVCGCQIHPIGRSRPLAIPSDADFLRVVTRIEGVHRARVTQPRSGATVTFDPMYQCYVTDWTTTNGYCPDPRD